MKKYIILASKSKRRSQILSSCGVRHKIFAANVKEHNGVVMPISKLVVFNAKKKTDYASKFFKEGIIVGVDTLVFLNRKPIGKPKTKKDAREILKALSGTNAEVYTGLYVFDKAVKKGAGDFDKTQIRVKKIEKGDFDRYFALLKPYDKAGGFSIEGVGAMLFDDLKGSYFNVLGLPMGKLQELFKHIGYNILDFIDIRQKRA